VPELDLDLPVRLHALIVRDSANDRRCVERA
jgi:hypothetical protein